MKKSLLISASVALAVFMGQVAKADIPLSYYSELNGKCGAELKTAIYNTIHPSKVLSYGSGSNKTWWGFYVTDYQMDGDQRQVVDRYSNDKRYFGDRGSSVEGMNIEHSFPKSWWGGDQNDAYKDLYNLMPCEAKINNSKSNYGMGVVTDATADNGCTKVGKGANGNRYWEPADQWKGDFARGYMYMATTYQDFTWTGEALNSLEQGAYPTLQPWAYKLYIQWAKEDGVNQMEIDRNEAVNAIQGNRNPYIDLPNLMEYVWGDSINVPLNLATTVKAGQTFGNTGGDDIAVTETVVYDQSYIGNAGGCTTSGTTGIWTVDAKYGWKGSGYIKGACTNADASVETAEIDLTKYNAATMVFEHAANKFNSGKPQDYFSVEISADGGQPQAVTVPEWPAGTNWTFISSGNIDISEFCGHKIKVVFHYTSDTDVAGTWEIETLKITGKSNTSTSVDDLIDDSDNDAEVEYYSIDGRRLNPNDLRGIVIRRQGHKVTKLIVR